MSITRMAEIHLHSYPTNQEIARKSSEKRQKSFFNRISALYQENPMEEPPCVRTNVKSLLFQVL